MNIGKSLKIAMAQKEMDTKLLARKMKLTVARINQIKNTHCHVGGETLGRLAAVFKMPVSEFIALGE